MSVSANQPSRAAGPSLPRGGTGGSRFWLVTIDGVAKVSRVVLSATEGCKADIVAQGRVASPNDWARRPLNVPLKSY